MIEHFHSATSSTRNVQQQQKLYYVALLCLIKFRVLSSVFVYLQQIVFAQHCSSNVAHFQFISARNIFIFIQIYVIRALLFIKKNHTNTHTDVREFNIVKKCQ